MPVRRPAAPLPPLDQALPLAHLQLLPATWSRLDSRNLQPRGPRARRHHRRRRKEEKASGSWGGSGTQVEGTEYTLMSVAETSPRNHKLFTFFCVEFHLFFGLAFHFNMKPKVPLWSSVINLFFEVQRRAYLKDRYAQINFVALQKKVS